MREIAVRGFINEKFNTTFGKGLFRRAVFNGSVELHKPNQKYLVDYYSYFEWETQAKSDEQMAVIKKLESTNVTQENDLLFSWLNLLDGSLGLFLLVNFRVSAFSPTQRHRPGESFMDKLPVGSLAPAGDLPESNRLQFLHEFPDLLWHTAG